MVRKNSGDAPIRADLGRPETPEETAARKAENSRNYRQAKTPNNLVVALVASLAIVLLTVLVVVRPDQPAAGPVDYALVADQAQPGVTTTLAVPTLPAEWAANNATLEPAADESFTWKIGFVTPQNQYLALEQGINTTPGWFAGFLGGAQPTGSVTIDGITWDVYDQRDSDDPGNFAYSLATTVADSDYLLHGTAEDSEFGLFASALAAELPVPTPTNGG
ncbi:MAG TPA: DUF4245 domain-containing protein [Glaciihabitans sp.]|nr:DUF4245 domain-containing protein [Glaciihabitans sp.]